MKAMIFAAGLGTRLRPLTDTMPKALVPVGGKPMLYHLVQRLKASGYDSIVVIVHHFSQMIKDYLAAEDNFGVDIQVSDESGFLLDTGGGILKAEPLLGEGSFLIHNVDIFSNLELSSLVLPQGALASLVVSERKTSRYLLFDADMRLVGWTNVSTGEVRSPWLGLDPSSCRALAFSGIHLCSHGIFDAFRRLGFEGRFPIMDFYLKACRDYPIHGIAPEGLKVLDLGKPEALQAADDFLEGV